MSSGYNKNKFALTEYKELKFPLSSGVFPIAVPPLHKFEGTHGDRVAGDNTNAIDFVAIASSLHATNGGRVVGNTNRLKAVSPSFVCQLRTQTAQSDGTKRRASTLAFLAALRLVFRLRSRTYR